MSKFSATGVPSKETVDYDKIYRFNTSKFDVESIFKKYLINRGGEGVDRGLVKHIADLRKAIIGYGGDLSFLPPIIVDINTSVIVDGNCRFTAVIDLLNDGVYDEMDLRVIFEDINPEEFDKRVRELNEGQKGWTLNSFIYNFAAVGNDNYQKLIDFCKSDETLHKPDGTIIPRYGIAALNKRQSALKDGKLEISDIELATGSIIVREAKDIRAKICKNQKANGGGWYESYLQAWADFRNNEKGGLGKISFKDYLREVSITVKNRKRDVQVPYGSNRKQEWNSFFRTVKTYC